MNNISFQGRTNLVFDNIIYDKLLNNRTKYHFTNINKKSIHEYKINSGRHFIFDPNEIKEPVIILINEKGGIFIKNPIDNLTKLLDKIDELKANTTTKLTSWIIGGQKNTQTTNKVNTLAEILCDRPDIDTSIIAGEKTVAPNITFYSKLDKFKLTLGLPPQKENFENVLEDCFDIVELNNVSI